MSIVWTILIVLGVVVTAFIAIFVYAAVVLHWQEEQTVGLYYFGLPLQERQRFKKRLRFHARLMKPVLWMSKGKKVDFHSGRIQHKGVSAPSDSCSLEGFQKAETYVPQPEDVF